MAKKSKPPISPLDQICSPEEAAAILDLTAVRVQQLVKLGELRGRKVGRGYVIELASVKEYGSQPKKKRGPKPKE